MHFGESGKSTFKLCVGIASIVLEGRLIGDEDTTSPFEHQNSHGKNRESILETFRQNESFFGFRRNEVKNLSTCVSEINTASNNKEFGIMGSSCGLFNAAFPSTSTSTPKKLNDKFEELDWGEYEGPCPKFSSFQPKLDRIRKSSSSSNVHSALQSANKSTKQQGIKQGPHCESFLRKMTMFKDNSNDIEHVCSHTNLSVSKQRNQTLESL
jgi:hypothetical protein